MVTDYLPIENYEHLLVTTDRQRANENACEGCGADFGTRWPHGRIIALVTDRSGSEQAHAHNDPECIQRTADRITNDEWMGE